MLEIFIVFFVVELRDKLLVRSNRAIFVSVPPKQVLATSPLVVSYVPTRYPLTSRGRLRLTNIPYYYSVFWGKFRSSQIVPQFPLLTWGRVAMPANLPYYYSLFWGNVSFLMSLQLSYTCWKISRHLFSVILIFVPTEIKSCKVGLSVPFTDVAC
mgnify:CR=1 FL=1